MQTEQALWPTAHQGPSALPTELAERAQLVLAFGDTAELRHPELISQLQHRYPQAHILCCSTAGQIVGTLVYDAGIAVTAIHFAHTTITAVQIAFDEMCDGFVLGRSLAGRLPHAGLRHVFVVLDGLTLNGSSFIHGLAQALPTGVTITGGLAADGARFAETLVGLDAAPCAHRIAAIGFYGDRLRVGFGSLGGWEAFGPERLITRARGNTLYELNGKSALDLYRMYLGDEAQHLPASGLRFPLGIRSNDRPIPLVRTLLAIDEAEHSMRFAGDLPEGMYARFMKATFASLLAGATAAATRSQEALATHPATLAILISCVGRKLLLQQRSEEEIEQVRDVLGTTATLAGFYSYGEIALFTFNDQCDLYNQTMTITTFAEV
ncbi:MAG: FIST C-terminal domain-containing protein [Ktedonobacterales bacterium]|nr:FIST C-terminal domain-containing protein [Ktedonobacterales bacterium]